MRQYKIISWCIQGHFEQFLNLCMTYCLANIPWKDHSKERYGELLWGKKEGKDIFSVCVNKYFLFVLTVRLPRPYISNKPVSTSLQWHKFLQMHHSFVFCHFLSIPSKIHLLVWVKSFQQHAFSWIIYLHSFTELFHKIFPCSSEQIAIIHENYCNLLW